MSCLLPDPCPLLFILYSFTFIKRKNSRNRTENASACFRRGLIGTHTMAKNILWFMAFLVMGGALALPYLNERSRVIASRLRMVRKLRSRTAFRQKQDDPVSLNTIPKGYTFDVCSYHRDCVAPRLCIKGDFTASCSGAANCICLAKATQLCTSCKECVDFPNETCTKYPEDDESVTGVCASTYTIYEGILVEKGCNNFPDLAAPSNNAAPMQSPTAMPSPTKTLTPKNGSTEVDDDKERRKRVEPEEEDVLGEQPEESEESLDDIASSEPDDHVGPCSSRDPSMHDLEASPSSQDYPPASSADMISDDTMYRSVEPAITAEDVHEPFDLPDCSLQPRPTSESYDDATGPIVFT